MPELTDMSVEWDVIVIGSGIAGLTAALTAAKANLKVIVLEKAALIGGTTAYSEAMIWAPNSDHARRAGIEDSADRALEYLKAAGGTPFDASLGAAYVTHAPLALRFLETETAARYELTTASIDYYPHLPGATQGSRAHTPRNFDGRRLGAQFNRLRAPLATTMILGGMSVMGPDLRHFYRVGRSLRSTLVVSRLLVRYAVDRLRGFSRGTQLTGGNGVLAALLLALNDLGVPVVTSAVASDLCVEHGRVVGVKVRPSAPDFKSNTQVVTLRAHRGVVLASGGFPHNPTLIAELYGHVAAGKSHFTLAPAENQGDGVSMARSIGATFNGKLLAPAAWAPVSMVPTKGGQIPVPHFGDRSKPGVIAVDRRGKRFNNEAVSYHDFVPAMVEACSQDPRVEVYLIADHAAQRKYGLGAAPPFPARLTSFIRSGYLVTGDTLRELAQRLSIDADEFENTVTRFNEDAARGVDSQFGKGGDAYGRSNGDASHRPNPCLAPLLMPPFYAVRVVPGDLGTFAGLRTDHHARVLNSTSTPIPGLYAVGSDMASAMGGAYPGAGVAVGSAVTFAYIAGRHLAATVPPEYLAPPVTSTQRASA